MRSSLIRSWFNRQFVSVLDCRLRCRRCDDPLGHDRRPKDPQYTTFVSSETSTTDDVNSPPSEPEYQQKRPEGPSGSLVDSIKLVEQPMTSTRVPQPPKLAQTLKDGNRVGELSDGDKVSQ